RLSQNANPGGTYDELDYGAFAVAQGVHMALMGDPTLRMSYEHVPSSYASINAQIRNNHTVTINWTTTENAEGYYVYHSTRAAGPFAKLNAVPVAAQSYTDSSAAGDSNYYLVRAVTRAGDSHGSYYSIGQASATVVVAGLADVAL